MHPYRYLMDRLGQRFHAGTLTLDLWDGATVTYGHGNPKARVKIKKASLIPALLFNTEMTFGEAYASGDIEVLGDLEEILELSCSNDDLLHPIYVAALKLRNRLARLRPLSTDKNRNDVSRHYDLGNDFYRLWLDPTMTYSCGYFRTPDDDLETAQRRKISHTLNKLCLQPGESLLDVGCGWGSLIREAANRYGVSALGITLSEAQVGFFETLSQAVPTEASVKLEHYHAVATQGMRFDKVVSVGMAEHIGQNNLQRFFRDLKTMLKPGGLCLLHCITTGSHEGPTNPWITKYIFPGGYLPSYREVMDGLSKEGLTVWDVENLGPHYALTLDRWSNRFEANSEWAEEHYGPEFVRMWRLYLRSSAFTFRRCALFVHQTLVSNGPPKQLPLTRERLYPSSDAKILANHSSDREKAVQDVGYALK